MKKILLILSLLNSILIYGQDKQNDFLILIYDLKSDTYGYVDNKGDTIVLKLKSMSPSEK
jgi:hypothetical protein